MVTIRKATKEQIEIALQGTNKLFDDNIIFKKFEPKGKNFTVTLTVKNAREKGSRLGFVFTEDQKPRHISAACWHVYGNFFDNLFTQKEDIEIVSNGEKITSSNGANWKDRNIGSQCKPMYYSEACECNKNNLDIPERF